MVNTPYTPKSRSKLGVSSVLAGDIAAANSSSTMMMMMEEEEGTSSPTPYHHLLATDNPMSPLGHADNDDDGAMMNAVDAKDVEMTDTWFGGGI